MDSIFKNPQTSKLKCQSERSMLNVEYSKLKWQMYSWKINVTVKGNRYKCKVMVTVERSKWKLKGQSESWKGTASRRLVIRLIRSLRPVRPIRHTRPIRPQIKSCKDDKKYTFSKFQVDWSHSAWKNYL